MHVWFVVASRFGGETELENMSNSVIIVVIIVVFRIEFRVPFRIF